MIDKDVSIKITLDNSEEISFIGDVIYKNCDLISNGSLSTIFYDIKLSKEIFDYLKNKSERIIFPMYNHYLPGHNIIMFEIVKKDQSHVNRFKVMLNEDRFIIDGREFEYPSHQVINIMNDKIGVFFDSSGMKKTILFYNFSQNFDYTTDKTFMNEVNVSISEIGISVMFISLLKRDMGLLLFMISLP